MTRLFLRFYAGVLIVLFLAWFIYGTVLEQRTESDLARVVIEAHGGGARLVAEKLSTTRDRGVTLDSLRKRFGYPINVVTVNELPGNAGRQISRTNGIAFVRFGTEQIGIAASLHDNDQVVQLGPFPNRSLEGIEDSMRGWARIAAAKIEAASLDRREETLASLRNDFAVAIEVVDANKLPDWPQKRMQAGEQIAFYLESRDRSFAATPLSNTSKVVRFGPFPSFERNDRKAATTTLALVLFPAPIAIALLLRPVAGQLRQMENAAKAIAAGDLSTRVDERRMRSARPLAHAFNHMADRTESFVRTQRELLQAVSHELRTPLARMRFAIDLIEVAKDEPERLQRLASLDAATEELDELVGELLSYVRMETTAPKLDCEEVAIQEMFDVLISKFEALYPNIRFTCETEPDSVLFLTADRIEFQRAIGNLVSNAGRHAHTRVSITANHEHDTIIIDVDDDGPGIAEADRERVFDPFVRLDDGQETSGAGLGLALVQRIVTKHGGAVSITTSPNSGCRVRTTWPTTPAANLQ